MVRKTCALRTLDAHRFGGTSGTSLSQPPLTVPGAESTLNWSRISRLEPPSSEQEETTKTDWGILKEPTDTLFDIPSPERSDTDGCQEDLTSAQEDTQGESIAATDDPTHLAGTVASPEDASPTDALTGREFIPEISLSEYIAHFHYEPPIEPQEVTMRGDAAPAEPMTSTAELETPPPVKTATAAPAVVADADVQVQPNAAPVGSSEPSSDCSRPLVVEESLGKKADLQPSALPGPSILELSDSLQITEPFEAADSSRKRPTWIVVGIVVAIALLGAIQWQRQARHTNSGAAAILNKQAQNTDPNKAISRLDNTQQSGALKQPLSTDEESTAAAETPKAAAALNEDRTSLTVPAPIHEKLSSSSVNAAAANPNAASHRKATANGNPDAPVELANRYIMGKGVPRSCEKAVLLLQSAAAKANVRACNRLASMYAIGSCVPRDRIQAYRWLGSALAADPHNEWALLNRDLTLHQMTAEERNQVENKPLVQRPRRPED